MMRRYEILMETMHRKRIEKYWGNHETPNETSAFLRREGINLY